MHEVEFAQRIVEEARRFIGTPYRHQASQCGLGCDCLGLIRGVWRALYADEPESPGAYERGWVIPPGDDILRDAARRHLFEIDCKHFRAGDVLLFRWRTDLAARHLGIATSDHSMVHAHEGAVVTEIPLGLWARKLAYAFRFPVRQIDKTKLILN